MKGIEWGINSTRLTDEKEYKLYKKKKKKKMLHHHHQATGRIETRNIQRFEKAKRVFIVEARINCAKERVCIDFYRVNTVSIFRTIPVGTGKFCFHTRSPCLHFLPCDIKRSITSRALNIIATKGTYLYTLEMSTEMGEKKEKKKKKEKYKKKMARNKMVPRVDEP